jgi:hypothetical protein
MIRITKIYDHGCPICEHMATFEGNVIFNLEAKPDFKVAELGRLLDPANENLWEQHLAQLAERYAVNPDYTIDLPVYMVTEGTNYLGHAVGELTATELRTKLQEIISVAQNKKSEAASNQ